MKDSIQTYLGKLNIHHNITDNGDHEMCTYFVNGNLCKIEMRIGYPKIGERQAITVLALSPANVSQERLIELFKNKGLRAEVDLRNEKISYKVREHSSKKVPIILAIGKNEKADNTVSIRRIGSNDSKVMDLDKAVQEITKENTI